MDNFSEIAALLVPELKKINISDPSVREAQKLLDGWDYTQEPTRPPPRTSTASGATS